MVALVKMVNIIIILIIMVTIEQIKKQIFVGIIACTKRNNSSTITNDSISNSDDNVMMSLMT